MSDGIDNIFQSALRNPGSIIVGEVRDVSAFDSLKPLNPEN